MFDLRGHTALVTGSNRGIGKAIMLALAKQHTDVYVHSREVTEEALQVIEEAMTFGVQAVHVSGDLSLDEAPEFIVQQMQQTLGMPDILILNASFQIRNAWQNITKEEFDYQMQVDYYANFRLIQLCVPYMQSRHWGRIIVIGSVQQTLPHSEMMVYASAKAAQMSMVKNLSVQLAKDGITVNNVAPGTIYTDRNMKVLSDEAYHTKVKNDIPVGYIGTPEDCTAPVVMLCSEEGRYITGINLYVDGGRHL
jgi:glucose 1-dehydrogenase